MSAVVDIEHLVEERDQEIRKIAESIQELSGIFKELAALVIDQGTILDRIDFNMEQVAEHTRRGPGGDREGGHGPCRRPREPRICRVLLARDHDHDDRAHPEAPIRQAAGTERRGGRDYALAKFGRSRPRHGRDDRAPGRRGDLPTGCVGAWRRAGDRKILKSMVSGDGGAAWTLAMATSS